MTVKVFFFSISCMYKSMFKYIRIYFVSVNMDCTKYSKVQPPALNDIEVWTTNRKCPPGQYRADVIPHSFLNIQLKY